MSLGRRQLLQFAAAGALAGPALVGCGKQESGTEAPSPEVAVSSPPAEVLGSLREVAERLGEAMLPGAAAAGFADYLETGLAAAPEDALLMLRYLGVPPPYRDFYLPALRATDEWARAQHGKAVAELDAAQLSQLVADLGANKPGDWGAAPAGFFYFVMRADAVDVVYGTRAGFERLGIPYMAHIEPARDW